MWLISFKHIIQITYLGQSIFSLLYLFSPLHFQSAESDFGVFVGCDLWAVSVVVVLFFFQYRPIVEEFLKHNSLYSFAHFTHTTRPIVCTRSKLFSQFDVVPSPSVALIKQPFVIGVFLLLLWCSINFRDIET